MYAQKLTLNEVSKEENNYHLNFNHAYVQIYKVIIIYHSSSYTAVLDINQNLLHVRIMSSKKKITSKVTSKNHFHDL